MIIGIPKEIKNNENRVAVTPSGVHAMKAAGHEVIVQSGAGTNAGFADDSYLAAGAQIALDASDVWASAEMIMKVKEPLPEEYGYFRSNLILFCYLHLAAEPELAVALTSRHVTAIAYESVQVDRTFPLLAPMSEIAGRMAVQIGAHYLEKHAGGKGILLGGVPGVKRGKVTIIGGGIVGSNAAIVAAGMGASVTVLDSNPARLRYLDEWFGTRIQTRLSDAGSIAETVADADLAIGAVLLPGAKAPTLVDEATVQAMERGSVIVDVAIDQGGIFATVDRVTSHDAPVYARHGVLHYAVPNIPGSVPRTSTIALCQSTLPYALKLAESGAAKAFAESDALACGVNTAGGWITLAAAARDLGMTYKPVADALAVANR